MPKNKSGNYEIGDFLATAKSPIATMDRAGILKCEVEHYSSWKFRLNKLFTSKRLTEALDP